MELSEIRNEHKFNKENLHRYLMQNVDDFPRTSSKLNIQQYRMGQSNPTFLLEKDDKKFVMRKKPPGQLLKGAHQIDREYQIQKALYNIGFPVPKQYIYCCDTNIIGTEFYIMAHVDGRIFRDPSLPGVHPRERAQIYASMNKTLAQLHDVYWRSIGLESYGKHSDYCKRQVSTWSRQYESAGSMASLPSVASANQLMKWLPANLPVDAKNTCIVHGDFRLDNLIFHEKLPAVVAVLDWELSTLGDPYADLAYNCLPYVWPKEIPLSIGVKNSSMSDLANVPGIWSLDDYLKLYCKIRSVPHPIPSWNFYQVLAFFKSMSISQGVYARSVLGNASSNIAIPHKYVKVLADAGIELVKSCEIVSDSDLSILQPQPGSAKGQKLLVAVKEFMKEHVYPAEKIYFEQLQESDTPWTVIPIMNTLKSKAKAAGLWNLFLPGVSGISVLEYAYMAEEMGRSLIAPEVFNCSAPDTGNMEVLYMYGNAEQKKSWLQPLLEGEIRSCFSMTEPQVASSDATNMECTMTRVGDEYLINGRKWWSSGAGDPRCKLIILMGRTGDTKNRHSSHSMIIIPMETPGVTKIRPLTVFGSVDAPHGHLELKFDNVRVPASNLILGEGKGFEIAQGRLGPGRIHHCMRLIGLAERSLTLMCDRAFQRKAFRKRLIEMGVIQHKIAECRIAIDQARLLVLKAAHTIDVKGTKAAKLQVAMIKVAVPRMAMSVIDEAIQVHGGAGVSSDTPLAQFYAGARSLRIADGPDEVHLSQIAKHEIFTQSKKSML
ncbi:acyl-CoA dehydrogenase family member 11-like isoform X2 [Anneissia japonica]|nr:acyl-CoA dehydrogenase family member 11-like isoform X2 [Anneissia japonica]XP_033103514.1 acyl-CoA dehydrogenase family member 11-like isoform X2 [Anneissia japonica]